MNSIIYIMKYEYEDQLKEISNHLENLIDMMEEEEYFKTDLKGFEKDFKELVDESELKIMEILKGDPDIPLDFVSFRSSGEKFQTEVHVTWGKFEQFVELEVQNLKTSIEKFLEEDDAPRRELFNQLTIPIMSMVNHQEHPTRPGYLVYHFKIKEHADYFEELMEKKELFYERFDEKRGKNEVFWFGVRDKDHHAVEVVNYTVKGKFRKPMISDKGARYAIVIFGVAIILFAIIGAIISHM